MTKIVPVTDFIRNFGEYADMLPRLESITLMRDGRPFATVQATAEEKNKDLFRLFGAWEGTELDNDKFWKPVFKRRNRKTKIKL